MKYLIPALLILVTTGHASAQIDSLTFDKGNVITGEIKSMDPILIWISSMTYP